MAISATVREKALAVMARAVCLALAVSAVNPCDRVTWWMGAAPALIAGPPPVATYRRFALTTLICSPILLQSLILIAGGAYTCARVPFGFRLAGWFHLMQNPYDKIGLLLARATNCSSGGPCWRWGRARTSVSARRAIDGIRNRTCSLRRSVPWRRLHCCREYRIVKRRVKRPSDNCARPMLCWVPIAGIE